LTDWTERWAPDAFVFALVANGISSTHRMSARRWSPSEAVLQIHSEGPFQRKFVESKKEEL
jgi:hypothetical protein